jgi:hypothetical protein
VHTRIIRVLCLLALVGGAALKGQPAAAERLVDEVLRPYYAHTGFSWKIDRSAHFELNYEADSEAEHRLSQLREVAEHGRTAILKMLGEDDYQPVVHVFFVGSIDRMRELIGSEVIGRSRPTQHAVFCVVAPFSELSLKHELTHEIATNLWGPAEHWLEEGLANYAVDNNSSLLKRQCLGMMLSKQWIPLKKLVSAGWESSSYSPDDTYPELGGFVEYLYQTYGAARFEQAWKSGSKSIKKVYGRRLPRLESDYRGALLKHRPEARDAISLPGRGELFLQEEVPHQHGIDP